MRLEFPTPTLYLLQSKSYELKTETQTPDLQVPTEIRYLGLWCDVDCFLQRTSHWSYSSMTDPEMFFDTLSNTHPIRRKWEKADPRNDQDYDTFDYGMETLPNDRTWCYRKAGITPPASPWKSQIK